MKFAQTMFPHDVLSTKTILGSLLTVPLCLQSCGYADTVVEGALVCLMNCGWRGHNGSSIGCIHFTELSIATCSPSKAHLVEASDHLRSSIKVRLFLVFSLKHY